MLMHQKGLLKAIRYFGSETALAKAMNASQQQVSYWLNASNKINYEYVLKIEAITEGYVTRYDLAPNQQLNQVVDQLVKASLQPCKTVGIDIALAKRLPAPFIAKTRTKYKLPSRPLLLDTQHQPIFYISQIYPYQHLADNKILAKIIDLELLQRIPCAALLFSENLLLSERIALNEMLLKKFNKEHEISTWQAVHRSNYPSKKKSNNMPFFQWLGIYSQEIYNCAKSVLKKGSAPLIAAMDEGLIEPDEATCITGLTIKEQLQYLNTKKVIPRGV
jgi:DNA-binding transcriptional regulator YdaS (Cro superfamily)